MFMPAALAIDWSPIRDAAIGGVPLPDLAERFGISFDALRQRSLRQKWPIPSRVRAKANEQGVADVSQRALEQAETATATLADSLLRNGEQSSLIGSNLLLGLLQKATLEKLQPLEHVADVVTAIKGARLTAGMDKTNTEVKVNLAMFAGQGESEEWVEVEQSQ